MQSKLVDVTLLSPNCTKPRNHKVDTLTPHHTAGVLSVENALEWFARSSTQASPNYIVGNDGRIGLSVAEENRPWTTSSRANDNRAITFEVCNSASGGNWPVSDKAFDALANLCTDICQRYGKKRLLWIPDKDKALAYEPKADEMLLTQHRWFANTNCPGEYLGGKFPELAERVTNELNKSETVKDPWYITDGTWAKAKELGLMDGTRPTDKITRAEVAAVAVRLYNKLKEG